MCLELLTLINKPVAPEHDKWFQSNTIQAQPSWAFTDICLLVVQLSVARIIKLLLSGRGDDKICPGFDLQGKRSY